MELFWLAGAHSPSPSKLLTHFYTRRFIIITKKKSFMEYFWTTPAMPPISVFIIFTSSSGHCEVIQAKHCKSPRKERPTMKLQLSDERNEIHARFKEWDIRSFTIRACKQSCIYAIVIAIDRDLLVMGKTNDAKLRMRSFFFIHAARVCNGGDVCWLHKLFMDFPLLLKSNFSCLPFT